MISISFESIAFAWLAFGFVSGLARVYQVYKFKLPDKVERIPFFLLLCASACLISALFGLFAPVVLLFVTPAED